MCVCVYPAAWWYVKELALALQTRRRVHNLLDNKISIPHSTTLAFVVVVVMAFGSFSFPSFFLFFLFEVQQFNQDEFWIER